MTCRLAASSACMALSSPFGWSLDATDALVPDSPELDTTSGWKRACSANFRVRLDV